jgi:peptide/nickel transport system permease protein
MVEAPAILAPARRPAWRRSPLTVAGLVLIILLALIAALAPIIAPADPLKQVLSTRLKPPSAAHWLGTDQLGRDVLSRMIYGARISLLIGTVVVGLAASIGTIVGLVAGYTGGWLDEGLMRLTDVFLAFPALILAMAISGALGPEYVEAARSLGASPGRIVWQHILPNTLAPLLVQASFDMGSAILSAAGLSFIGFGAQPPTAEWGVMISDGRNYIVTQPWLSLFPGLAILLTVAAFNLIGDGLRDALDPRLRGGA